MATRAITLLLLSVAFNKAYATPVALCPCPPGAPATPEVYTQNGGKPLVVIAKDPAPGSLCLPPTPPILPPVPLPPCSGTAPLLPPPAPILIPGLPPSLEPVPIALPPSTAPIPIPGLPALPDSTAEDLAVGQKLADQSIAESALPTIPAPNKPCKVETSTEVVQQPGDTFVHQPGEITINQPPTRLIINHAPYVVRPGPVVFNSGSKTITNAYTRKYLGSAIQVRPYVVRLYKPIERKILIDKPAPPPSGNTYTQTPPIPDACTGVLAPAAPALPVSGLPALPVPVLPAIPGYPSNLGYELTAAGQTLPEGAQTAEIATASGPASVLVPPTAGCGCV